MSSGWHFLQIPGPSNVPERVRRAISEPVIDHRGEEFAQLGRDVIAGLKRVLKTDHTIALYPASGTGGWEAALANTLAPGDSVLLCENGYFATLWGDLAERHRLKVKRIAGDWRSAPDPEQVQAALAKDTSRLLKAVLVTHNETSTGALADVKSIREAIDDAHHSALLLVDAISSLGSTEYEHDGWGVDVTISASQKGLMLPPGLAFTAMSPRAIDTSTNGGSPRSYWDWAPMIAANETGSFPYTPATNLLYGLREALRMLDEEGLEHVFSRHRRHAAATLSAVEHWQLEVACTDVSARSPVLTGVLVPPGHDANDVRRAALDLNMSLGAGLGQLAGKAFRVGHLGYFNDLMLLGVVSGIELALSRSGVPHNPGGADAALRHLESH